MKGKPDLRCEGKTDVQMDETSGVSVNQGTISRIQNPSVRSKKKMLVRGKLQHMGTSLRPKRTTIGEGRDRFQSKRKNANTLKIGHLNERH